jgi:hypothetical protein
VEALTEEPVEEPAEEPAEEPVEVPAEEPVEEPAEEPVEAPAEVPAEVRDLCRNWRESDLQADPFYEKYFFLEDWKGTYYGYQISEPSRKSLITRYTPAGE